MQDERDKREFRRKIVDEAFDVNEIASVALYLLDALRGYRETPGVNVVCAVNVVKLLADDSMQRTLKQEQIDCVYSTALDIYNQIEDDISSQDEQEDFDT